MKDLLFVKRYEQSLRDNFELPALTDYRSETTYTYGDVAREIEKLHILFSECKVQKGDKIALIGKNNSRWCVAYLATVTYGAVIVPILHDFNPNDVHNIVNHSDSQYLFSSDSIWESLDIGKMENIKAVLSLDGMKVLFEKNEDTIAGFISRLDEKFSEKYPDGFTEKNIHYSDVSDDNLAVLNYTSGTMGFSKGVMISGANLMGNLKYAHDTIRLNRGENMLSFLPLAHTYGSAFEFLFPFMEGCHITLLNKTPSPQILLKAFAEVKPVLIISVPLILEKIYRRMIQPVLSKGSMRLALSIPILNNQIYGQFRKKLVDAFGGNFSQVVIGGAPLNSEVEDFLLKIKFPVTVGYGMTECAPLISFTPADSYVAHSCGKTLPAMQVRIDSDDPENVAGEIQVKGVNVMLGYYKNEEATKEAFTEDGWLKTGDLGTVDKDNNVFIRGRSKSMILGASGQNIYPEEIEAKLDNLPFVQESLVVQRDGKLIALVYPDLESLESAGLKEENLKTIMEENKEALNNMVAGYERITEIQLSPKELEKTPKKSIKRFLYS